ncbi:Uma2 family endonuclease [Pendulispora rubella]|uniref:Uma2 family endonuclease n=1 Tax=Pendulispora rubella TaxID=2741070 RepID=A0ABZ2KXQ6_9BACT
MGDPARKKATYEDILALPEGITGEILGGVLHTRPRPRVKHANAGSALGALIMGPFKFGRGGPGGWVILDEPELHAPAGDIAVPDLAGWRRERMPELPDVLYIELCPDWVCEILSPSTAVLDRREKMPFYLQWGVRHLWLVDPALHTLEIYRAEHERWMLLGTWSENDVLRAEPFDAIELELGLLWQR